MKNIHVLPTSQPSRLFNCFGKLDIGEYITTREDLQVTNQHIYITSAEEIKDSWVLNTHTNEVYFLKGYYGIQPITKKVILTTDGDLIKKGVQAIDDTFLEWFVKNPSCESVEVVKEGYKKNDMIDEATSYRYKIIIPKKEPRILTVEAFNKAKISYKEPKQDEIMERFIANAKQQETLEEAIERLYGDGTDCEGDIIKSAIRVGRIDAFYDAAKWQQERSYSEEEVLEITQQLRLKLKLGVLKWQDDFEFDLDEWFEQFKKK